MSMLLLLTINCYWIPKTSSELFTTGVGWITSRSESENNLGTILQNFRANLPGVRTQSACLLLQKQAAYAWKTGGFRECFSNPTIYFGLDLQITSYRIAVDSEAFQSYPEHGPYFEQYAFVNKKLNEPGKHCVTVTGSNWWAVQRADNRTYDIRMFYYSYQKNLHMSVCSTLNNLPEDTSTILRLYNCSSKPLGKTRNQWTHEIHLTIRISSHEVLLSESIHKSIEVISAKINVISDHCVHVIGVLKNDFYRAADIYLQFSAGINDTNSCALLIKSRYIAYYSCGFLTCENDIISYTRLQRSKHSVRLRVRGRLSGIPLYLLSKAEIALRVEALFNVDKLGCITSEPGQTAYLLKKSERRLVSFISGPSYADVCKQVKQMMGTTFYYFYNSCVKDMTDSAQLHDNRLSSHRLDANEPFYEIDELPYLEQHAQLVYNLNEPHLSCEYNGYIEMKQRSNEQ